MHKEFKIYQANVGKMSETQHSIMNAEYLKEFALLLIQEPYVYQDEEKKWQPGPRKHMYWNPLLLGPDEDNSRPRAMIWTHKDLTARPINTYSPDLAAVLLPESLHNINRIVDETRRGQRNRVELIIAGDHIGTTDRQGEAEGIIDLMADMDLQSAAPRRVATWHSRDDTRETTIDLILITPELMNEVCRCTIDSIEHGSDHSAIQTELVIEWQSPNAKPRRLWRKTRWIKIRRIVEAIK
ncbi:hypothetical protein K469DRAFT_727832 [Zopfia rhizophila CBS 207.26]|uniref:Endonuclease/exonuclease/phosphatase domain-containing protein n=1 Tax=Zopfia rhizophila CBS 207.26 TaxID=1314779 RepID=A0A6A6DW32_9PEZI|nr:hypothetical protein K469DRAFT_727832 [Zopfia rhizophila CBS 207.26]